MPEQGSNGETMKREAWVTDEEVARLVALLQAEASHRPTGDEPRSLPAGRIADRLALFPDQSHESRRRRVRELVNAARLAGHPIVSNGHGTWWAATAAELDDYRDWRRKFGLADLVAASRATTTPAAAELRGQSSLF